MIIGTQLTLHAQAADDPTAKLVVYRRPEFNFLRFGVKINGETLLPSVNTKSYYIAELPPGRIELETFGHPLNEGKRYTLMLAAGETYYLEAFTEFQAWLVTLHLLRRSNDIGEEAIKKLNGRVLPTQEMEVKNEE